MRSLALVAIALLVAGCAAGTTSGAGASARSMGPGGSPPAASLTVYAAASLKAALASAATAYEARHPGTSIVVSTDSSAALEAKIEQGAPADVFLSADTANPQKLADAGLAAGRPVAFAGNLLTIVVPKGNPAGIRSPADLARPGIRIVAAGDAVPITRYAVRLVDNLAGLAGYPAGFASAYAANVVSREDNVGAVVAKIALGEGDAGICYVTDARASDGVATIAVPRDANVPATYAGVVVRASPRQAAATAFLAWLAGPGGRAVLATFGFLPPP